MKTCPSCNEIFTDEFSFCELDGTKLKRSDAAATEPGAKKDWSLLGLVLVLGAVLITVATIIFAPKARFSASNPTKDTVAVAPPQQTTPSTSAVIDTTPSAGADTPSTELDASLPSPETKRKEKAAKSETDESAANPKAAAQDPDTNSKDAKAAVQPSEPPAPKAAAKTEPAATETREPERPRSVAPAPEPRESKKAEAKPAEKEDPKKKDEKKKKGGFFGVFKKIFGKDN
jgi:cell division protein FtsN